MPVKRRKAKQRRVEVPVDVVALLSALEPENAVEFFMTDPNLRVAWGRVRDEILTGWIEGHPGTRPLHWWRYDAPEPRRRLGVAGEAVWRGGQRVEIRGGIYEAANAI